MPTYICPTCQKKTQAPRRADLPLRPFCSERCKYLDLHKWFNEEYRVELPMQPPTAPAQPGAPPPHPGPPDE